MKITTRTALELLAHEAIVRQTYKDSVGVLTWSVGITNASGHSVDRYIGNPAPLEECLGVYVWALEKYADTVRKVFKGHTLTEAQFAAALSFHYNTGAIARASWVKTWKAGNVSKARAQIMNWVTPVEITERRRKEQALFFDGKWSGDGTCLEYTSVSSGMRPRSPRRINVKPTLEHMLAGVPAPAPAAPKATPVAPVEPVVAPEVPASPETPEAAPEAPQPLLTRILTAVLAATFAAIRKAFTK